MDDPHAGNEIQTTKQATGRTVSVFNDMKMFEDAQRMARVLTSSKIVPVAYQGPDKLPDAIIAIEMAQRIGASPISVMQNLYIVHGKPSWSASFIAAAIASSGRFSPVRYKMSGTENESDRTCVAWATDDTGEVLEGPPVSIGVAQAEGWYSKNGSKWKTMPELMLRYRAITFFGRLYAPDILMGMRTQEESYDIGPEEVNVTPAQEVDLNSAPVNEPVEQEPDKGEPVQAEKKAKPPMVKDEPDDGYVSGEDTTDWSKFTQEETKLDIKMKSGKVWVGVYVGVSGDEVALRVNGGMEMLKVTNVASVTESK